MGTKITINRKDSVNVIELFAYNIDLSKFWIDWTQN
jgi:hypothetical protein